METFFNEARKGCIVVPGETPVNMKLMTDTLELFMIEKALVANNGNISRTAAHLFISRQGLKNKIKAYGITVERP